MTKENINQIKREKLLWQLIANVRNNIDINEIKKSSVYGLSEVMNLDRCFILEYDENQKSLPIDEFSEYLSAKEKKSMIGVDLEKDYDFEHWTKILIDLYLNKNETILFVSDSNEYIKENNLYTPKLEKYRADYHWKSGVGYSFFEKNKIKMLFVVNFKKTKLYSSKEIEFIRTFVEQIYIAINQSKAIKQIEQTAQKEALLKKIIQTIRGNIDINQVKNSIVNEIGKLFNADRCHIRLIDQKNNEFLPIDEHSEYLSSNENKSIIGLITEKTAFLKYFKNTFESNKDFVIPDKEAFLTLDKDEVKPITEVFEMFNIKSFYGFPIFHSDKLVAAIIIMYEKKAVKLNETDITFIKNVASAVGIAIYQSILYEKEKQAVERESLLRKTLEIIRSSLDIEQIKKNIVTQAGKIFEADRCFIRFFDSEKDEFLTTDTEYLSSPEVKSIIGYTFDKRFDNWIKPVHKAGNIVIVKDINELMAERGVSEQLQLIDIKSGYGVPIIIEGRFAATFVLHYIKKQVVLSEEDLIFLKSISDQAAIAINQAELYEKEKETAGREKLLRKIIETIRTTIDLNELQKIFVTEIGKLFNADRCFIFQLDENKKIYNTTEYLSSSDIKSIIGFDKQKEQYWLSEALKEDLLLTDINKYIKEHNLQGTPADEHVQEYKVKSTLTMRIYFANKIIGVIALHYTKAPGSLSSENMNFFRTISNQLGIALNQAYTYEKEKQTAKREVLSRKIIEIIRSTLDRKEIIHNCVTEIGRTFDAGRCFIYELETDKLEGYVYNYGEYLQSPEEKSIRNRLFKSSDLEWITINIINRTGFYIQDTQKYLEETNKFGTNIEKHILEFNIKSVIAISLISENEVIGSFVLHFNKTNPISEEEYDLIKTLVKQTEIGIYQAKLYEKEKETAEKERILKEIISEIKLTTNLKQAYNKLLEKLTEIFGLNRALFLESSTINPDELNIKYEYVIDRADLSVNNLVFPRVCTNQFLNLIHNLETFIINDINECYPEYISDFFEKYKIKALLAVPLVKYNKDIKVFGFIVLCAEEIRTWSKYEINLIKTISDSVVSVIWEISKFVETEEMRNTFVLTLAHDINVPLIGEKLALEAIIKTSNDKNKEIIKEIIDNNNNISIMLNKSVDIYNYESGKQKLDFEIHEISKILEENIKTLTDYANSKSVKIQLHKIKDSLFVSLDKAEIMKVFFTIIENAIDHSPSGEPVEIKYYEKNNYVITSFHNGGKAISKEMQDKIFKRYEMALAIERKIGAGTGLFLAKKIIEAHNGFIWFKTRPQEGTTFYLSLPLCYLE